MSGVAVNGQTLQLAVHAVFSACVANSVPHSDVVVDAGVAPAVAKVVRVHHTY